MIAGFMRHPVPALVIGATLAAARSAEVDTKGLDKTAVAHKVGELVGDQISAPAIMQIIARQRDET